MPFLLIIPSDNMLAKQSHWMHIEKIILYWETRCECNAASEWQGNFLVAGWILFPAPVCSILSHCEGRKINLSILKWAHFVFQAQVHWRTVPWKMMPDPHLFLQALTWKVRDWSGCVLQGGRVKERGGKTHLVVCERTWNRGWEPFSAREADSS